MFDTKIKQFQNQMDDLDKEMPEQIEIRHAYRTRRFEYIKNVAALCVVFPVCIAMFVMTLCTIQNYISVGQAHLLMVCTMLIGAFIITPLVVKKQQNSVKQHNHLIKGKSMKERQIGDFENYVNRLHLLAKKDICRKTIENIEHEKALHEEKNALLAKLKEDYEFIPKEKEPQTFDVSAINVEIDEYEGELKQKLRKYAFANYFKCAFKIDIMTKLMEGMMAGMLCTVVWNLPTIFRGLANTNTEASPVSSTGNIVVGIFLQVLLPLIIGMVAPIAWELILRKEKQVYKELAKEVGCEKDMKRYAEEVSSEYLDECNQVVEKIASRNTVISLLN